VRSTASNDIAPPITASFHCGKAKVISPILMAKADIMTGNDANADGIKRDVSPAGLFAREKGLSCQEWKNHRGIRIWQSTLYMFN
jgi:hypothetical protein